jgi:DNA-binding CsgD family transcriptional regulator
MNDPGRLTEREAAVAERAARGQTNDEIARALLVSPKTVEWNLTRVYRKLGVRSRTELAALAATQVRGKARR